MITKRLALAPDEQLIYMPTVVSACRFLDKALGDYRNHETLQQLAKELSKKQQQAKKPALDEVRELVANELAIKTLRVVEKKPKTWGKAAG